MLRAGGFVGYGEHWLVRSNVLDQRSSEHAISRDVTIKLLTPLYAAVKVGSSVQST